jgi:hypothetical protein
MYSLLYVTTNLYLSLCRLVLLPIVVATQSRDFVDLGFIIPYFEDIPATDKKYKIHFNKFIKTRDIKYNI